MITVIPFVKSSTVDSPNATSDRSEHPSEPYFRAMTVAFGSLRRWDPTASLVLATNEKPTAPHAQNFRELGVQTELIPYDHSPPPGFNDRFRSCFFILDVLSRYADSGMDVLLLDPDVIAIDSVSVIDSMTVGGVGVLDLGYQESHDINGVTPAAGRELRFQIGGQADDVVHFGGECYFVPVDLVAAVVERLEGAWSFSLAQFTSGHAYFTTEEHMMNYAVAQLPRCELGTVVRRIWTSVGHSNVRGDEDSLIIWHLPAEKSRGFDRLYPSVVDKSSWFWTADRESFVGELRHTLNFRPRRAGRMLHELRRRAIARKP